MDGYETTKEEDITKKLFDQYGSVARKQMQKEGSVAAGSPVYKLVTSNDWSIVVKLVTVTTGIKGQNKCPCNHYKG